MGILKVSTAEQKLSDLRLSICGSCQHATQSSFLEMVNGDMEVVDSLKCNKCGCPCLEKTLVIDETCPENNW